MTKFNVTASNDLLRALSELDGKYGFALSPKGIPTRIEENSESLVTSFKAGVLTVKVQKRVQVFYALKQFADTFGDKLPEEGYELTEKPSFRDLNFMLDYSRNAVPTVATTEEYVRLLAVMGYDTFMMYMEDTFAVKEYPYFGYLRNPYSGEDIHRVDEYCKLFGIELVPCMQTLAHFNSLIRHPSMGHLFDVNDILFVGEEETYKFIEAMISACAESFSTHRIHIGMDEAYMLGRGKYLDKNGYRNRTDIMNEHLARVLEICRKYGYTQPMIWSDMYFSMALNSQYGCDLPAEVIDKVPPEVELIYWDYCSADVDHFAENMRKHQVFRNEIGFAAGAFKWHGYSPDNRFSLEECAAAAKACVQTGVRDYIITAWGDNGAECSAFGILPTLSYCSRLNYGHYERGREFEYAFETLTGMPYSAFMTIDLGNRVTENDDIYERNTANKYLMFNDILLGTLDTIIDDGQGKLYEKHAAEVKAAKKVAGRWKYIFKTQERLNEVLAVKADLGVKLRAAYGSGDKAKLEREYEKLKKLPALIEKFYKALRAQWDTENRPNGFDVQDIRIGALKQRIAVAIKKIGDYLDGKTDCVPELAEKLLCFMGHGEEFEKDYDQCEFRWRRMTSVNVNE